MGKRLFLLLLASFIGIANAPEVLMASDTVELTGLDNARIVETVPIAEEEPVQEEAPAPEPARNVAAHNTSTVAAPVYTAPVLENYVSIGGRTIEMIDSNDTRNDAGRYVARYNDYFLYGHNSAAVFDVLYRVSVGEVFSVSYGGVVKNYQIKNIVIYRKTDSVTLQIDDTGHSANGEEVKMRYVAQGKDRAGGIQYGIALMTCYGTSYGNGDASHRLVVFADAI